MYLIFDFVLQLECCGPHGNITSRYSWAFYKGRTDWYLKRPSQKSKFISQYKWKLNIGKRYYKSNSIDKKTPTRLT